MTLPDPTTTPHTPASSDGKAVRAKRTLSARVHYTDTSDRAVTVDLDETDIVVRADDGPAMVLSQSDFDLLVHEVASFRQTVDASNRQSTHISS